MSNNSENDNELKELQSEYTKAVILKSLPGTIIALWFILYIFFIRGFLMIIVFFVILIIGLIIFIKFSKNKSPAALQLKIKELQKERIKRKLDNL